MPSLAPHYRGPCDEQHSVASAPMKMTRRLRSTFKFLSSAKGLPLWAALCGAVPVDAHVLDMGTFSYLAQRCGSRVAVLTLAALAKTESRFETLVVSDNTTHIARTYPTREQAAAAARQLIARGDSVDLGIMQINSANLRRLGITVEDTLDPCRAISAAASIMTSNYRATARSATQQVALRNAISMYNTGNVTFGYKNGYVKRVEDAARSLTTPFSPAASVSPARYVRYTPPTTISPGAETWDVWAGSGS